MLFPFPYIPSPPIVPEPPPALVQIANEAVPVALPPGCQSGLTTTQDGNWALLVNVPPGTHVPIQTIETIVRGYPVIYQAMPDTPPVARPAYPSLGE